MPCECQCWALNGLRRVVTMRAQLVALGWLLAALLSSPGARAAHPRACVGRLRDGAAGDAHLRMWCCNNAHDGKTLYMPTPDPLALYSVRIVGPVTDHTKLEVDPEGLRILQSIQGEVAPVVVIGPYRSGKSFLLNQLMNVTCDTGFGVGHTRETQTKGVWMWSESFPQVVEGESKTVQVLYFDTEGFESTGKANVYDDRIFALSALMSSVLIYNLPEAIRESDLERLSFAVELSKAFFGQGRGAPPDGDAWQGASQSESQAARRGALEEAEEAALEEESALDEAAIAALEDSTPPPIRPGSMLWLIQRDFLHGDSPQRTLQRALVPVPNPHKDAGLAQLNRIRASLLRLAANSTALGLPQPHLDRTALCGLRDADLAPGYLQARARVRLAVEAQARPKLVRGSALSGLGLAALVEATVTALNERAMPTAGSLTDYFNRELVQACRADLATALDSRALPEETRSLDYAAAAAARAAERRLARERFGGDLRELLAQLRRELAREVKMRAAANAAASAAACARAEQACERALEAQARMRLPSRARLAAAHAACAAEFDAACVGPAREGERRRLRAAWDREEGRFVKEYNERLLGGVQLLSVAAIVIFRWVVPARLAESAAWAAFVFLNLYPKTFVGEASMFDAPWWVALAGVWDALVYNRLLDLERGGVFLAGAGLCAAVTRRWWLPRLARWSRRRGAGGARKRQAERDLDV